MMPVEILTEKELNLIIKKAGDSELRRVIKPNFIKKGKLPNFRSLSFQDKQKMFIGINETLRRYLQLRDTDKIATAKTKYTRRAS